MNISITQHSTLITYNSPKGNISLIMLFVLAIGSLIGLLSTIVIQDMISSTGSLRDFYQSYYLSKGWLELGILSVEKYEYGFEDTLTGSDTIIKNNLNCTTNCSLWLTITSRIKVPVGQTSVTFWTTAENIDACNSLTPNKIILSGGWSYVLPLFIDQRSLKNNITWNPIQWNLSQYNIKIQPTSTETSHLWLWIALWSGNKDIYDNDLTGNNKPDLYITGTTLNIKEFLHNQAQKDWSHPLPQIASTFNQETFAVWADFYNYLFITNLDTTPFSFCLQAEPNSNGYSIDTATVTSIGTYNATTIGLQANIKKPLPDYIINSYSEYQ